MKTIMLLLLLVGVAHAQIPDNELTLGTVNCRWWATRNENWKLGYVLGFGEAAQYSGDKLTMAIMGDGVTYGEYVRGVDELCAVPENAILHAYRMIMIFTKKFQGVPADQINRELESDRKWFSAPPTPTKPAQKTGGKKQ